MICDQDFYPCFFDLAAMEMNAIRLSGFHSQQSEFNGCNPAIGALSAPRVKNPNSSIIVVAVKDGKFPELTHWRICIAFESLLTSHSVLSPSKIVLIPNPYADGPLRGHHGGLKHLLPPYIVPPWSLQSHSSQKAALILRPALSVLISKLLMMGHILRQIRRQ